MKKPDTGKRQDLSQAMLVKLEVCMSNNVNRSISFTIHKTQVQVDQKPHQKTTYTEPDRRERGEDP